MARRRRRKVRWPRGGCVLWFRRRSGPAAPI